MMQRSKSVVIPWGAGMYTFRYRWQALLVSWLMPRWTSWTGWEFVSDMDKECMLKPHLPQNYKVQLPITRTRRY